ncbi:MAG: ABC transporter substrate-binding protein, partial [Nitrospirales bacterium]
MSIKRLLLIAPLVLVTLLAQSYFWAPTYDTQAVGNPERLVTYIEGSIGDAKILNPILNADTASAQIVGLVFEGLLDFDEHLKLRGRLATDWTITEEAYLSVNPRQRFPDGVHVTGERLATRIRRALNERRLEDLSDIIRSVELRPATTQVRHVAVRTATPEGGMMVLDVPVTIHLPPRIALTLTRVDQDLFLKLTPVIGKQYAEGFPYDRFIELPNDQSPEVLAQLRARVPELVPVEEHNPVIVFDLRPGVRFHDGHEFDAGDVTFTYESIMNPKNLSPRTSDFEPIKQVDILDRYRVRIVYSHLFSPAINAWTMGILPEHLLNEAALELEMDARGLSQAARRTFGLRDSRFNRHPVGTGPFRFAEWRTDEFIHLERNDGYWEGQPEYAHYYMRIIPDILTQEVEFRAGAIDFYGAMPHQVARYRKDPAYQAFSTLQRAYTYIGYNHRKPLFADPRVRRALGMAINVDEFIEYILYGQGERTTGPYPKNTEWYDHAVQPLPYDPQGALELLNELGWRRNRDGWLERDGTVFEFNLITNSGNPIRKNIMTIAQNAWKKIGIKCNTQYFEWAVFLKDFVNTGEFDSVVLGWSMGIDSDLFQIWHSSQAGPQQLNFVGYRNPEADQLMVRI